MLLKIILFVSVLAFNAFPFPIIGKAYQAQTNESLQSLNSIELTPDNTITLRGEKKL